jgi:hypothetical protein
MRPRMIHRTGNNGWLLLLVALMAALIFSNGAIAALSVTVDRTEMTDADLLKLTIRVENATTAANPDFGALELDFEVVQRSGPNQSSRTSIINGRMTSEVFVTWELRLRPKRLGTLFIPAFRIGTDTSDPIRIIANRQSDAMKQQMSQLVFFDTSVDTNETYVQGQIIYTIKLYYVENISGDFPPIPSIQDAVVETIEGERRYDTISNGRRYYVLEKRYGIYPQKSGNLTIPVQSFSGFRVGPGFFSTREPILSRSKSHSVTVKARPTAFSGEHWLPAANVTIEETWLGGPPEFTVGEPVNRSIVISASGVAASLLPPLSDTPIDGAKTYQDPPIEDQTLTAEGIAATQTVVVGIVPTRPGLLQLPAIEIPWWNTRTDQLEVARIAAQTFNVTPSPKNQQAFSQPSNSTASSAIPGAMSAPTAAAPYWQYIAIGLFSLWMVTLLLWFAQSRRRPPSSPTEERPRTIDQGQLLKDLKSACSANDAPAAQLLAIQWGHFRYGDIHSLQGIAKRAESQELVAALADLEDSLYAPDASGRWQGKSLWQAIQSIGRRKDSTQKQSRLTSTLNPG